MYGGKEVGGGGKFRRKESRESDKAEERDEGTLVGKMTIWMERERGLTQFYFTVGVG